jgi:HEAT repeat protein
MRHVFISYHHNDGDFAEVLINRIEKAGFETWVDNDRLHAGEDWRAEIDQAIKAALALIVIMTPEARSSEYVTYEWAFAWGAGVKVIPVLYKDTKLHPRLEALQYLNFTSRIARPWDDLIEAVKNAASSYIPNSISSVQNIPPYLRQAIEELDSARVNVRKKAIESLAQLDLPMAEEALIGAMQHPLQDVRIQAALILIGHNDLRALPGVLEALEVDDYSIRQSAYKTIDEIINDENIKKEGIPFLIETLRNKKRKDHVRAKVLTMLGRIGDSSVVPSVIEAVQDKSYNVSASALSVLGEIGDASAISTLGDALQSQSEYHRQQALEALAKIGDVTAIPYLLEALRSEVSMKDYIQIESALRQIGDRLRQKGDTTAIPMLLEALRDRKSKVRSGAAETLGEIGSKDVTTNLLETLNPRDTQRVRLSVIVTAGGVGSSK